MFSASSRPRRCPGDGTEMPSPCSIPFSLKNFLNSSLVNCGPLSVTIVVGKLFLQKMAFSWSITTLVVVFHKGTASGHLVAMSM